MAKQDWLDYFNLLGKLADTLTELSAMQEEKKVAVEKGNLPRIDEMMKQEQVFAMTLRGYEQKRLKALAVLSVPPGSVGELEQHMPLDVRGEGKRVVARLQSSYSRYRETANIAKETLEHHLNLIETRTGIPSGYVPPAKSPRKQETGEGKVQRSGGVPMNLRQLQKDKVEQPKIVPVSQAQLAQVQKEQDERVKEIMSGHSFNAVGNMSDLRQLAQQQEKSRLSALRQKTLQENAEANT